MKQFIVLILLILSAISCSSPNDDSLFILKGQFLVSSNHGDIKIIHKNKETTINLNDGKYSGLNWLYHSNELLGCELVYDNGFLVKSEMVKVNLDSLTKEKIYAANNLEYVFNVFPSKSDKKIFFTKHHTKTVSDKLSYSKVDFLIMNQKHEIIKEFKNICNFGRGTKFNESPWSNDESKIVYSYSNTDNNSDSKPTGIYIFNLQTGKEERISDEGEFASWSPAENKIAYVSDNDIIVYDLKSQTTVVYFKNRSYEWVINLHWSPDGEYLFVNTFRQLLNIKLFHSYNEYLIRLSDGKQIPFKKIGLGNVHYSWK